VISLLDAAIQGHGLYSIAEAARYARVPTATIRNWFFPSKSRPAMQRGEIDSAEEKALTFLDFVELLAVRSLRVDYQVSLSTIRQAIEFAQKEFEVQHVFAHADHKTFIDPKKKLHITISGNPNPMKMGGKGAGQLFFQQCIEGFMKDLAFNEDKMASLYTTAQYGDQRIIMNPAFRFGEPIMEENGYPADVLWRGVIAEGSFERAATLYDASVPSVQAAYRYCNEGLAMAA
jgi:uncharacterized protein (DUF433 family)